ncbi:hypothetical protein FOA52_000544 [Chlamydomonas sp. UWO 241]|nr:hypothetical protein FOA52_000544 [Chlamydomonas sp. UWO 241]
MAKFARVLCELPLFAPEKPAELMTDVVNRRYPAFWGTFFHSLVYLWDQHSTTVGEAMKHFRDGAIASLQGSPPLFYALQFALTPGRWKDRRLLSELMRATI